MTERHTDAGEAPASTDPQNNSLPPDPEPEKCLMPMPSWRPTTPSRNF